MNAATETQVAAFVPMVGIVAGFAGYAPRFTVVEKPRPIVKKRVERARQMQHAQRNRSGR